MTRYGRWRGPLLAACLASIASVLPLAAPGAARAASNSSVNGICTLAYARAHAISARPLTDTDAIAAVEHDTAAVVQLTATRLRAMKATALANAFSAYAAAKFRMAVVYANGGDWKSASVRVDRTGAAAAHIARQLRAAACVKLAGV
jgi:hypothetical protein